MSDHFDVQRALQDAKGRVFIGLTRRVRPARRDALSFTFKDGGEIEIPGSTPDYIIMSAAIFDSGVRVGGTYVREDLNDITDVSLVSRMGEKIARVRLMRPPTHMAEDRGDIGHQLQDKTVEAVRLSNRDVSVVYWDSQSRYHKAVSFDAVSVRVNTSILPATVKRVSYESYADRVDVLGQHNTLILSADRPRRALDRTADGGILTDIGDW